MTIHKTGVHLASKMIKDLAFAYADDSFTAHVQIDVKDLPDPPENYEYVLQSAIALKIRGSVEPHTDDSPLYDRLALFWVLTNSLSDNYITLMVEGSYCRMYPESYAFFNDSWLHAVIAKNTWRGISI